jgi:hypothetical protein
MTLRVVPEGLAAACAGVEALTARLAAAHAVAAPLITAVAPAAVDPVSLQGASDSGAGSPGFAGRVSKASVQAAGLATLPSDDFGDGPSVPMPTHSWTQGERTDPR